MSILIKLNDVLVDRNVSANDKLWWLSCAYGNFMQISIIYLIVIAVASDEFILRWKWSAQFLYFADLLIEIGLRFSE